MRPLACNRSTRVPRESRPETILACGGGIVKTFRLADYATDGVLQDLDDARFFARKLGPEDRLDFEGVTAVSSDSAF